MIKTAFSNLKLQPLLLENLTSLGYQRMTPIQAQSLPPILEGRDVIAQAKTGSGKTAAFGLSLLEKVDVKRFQIQSLVLCPTRELADQVTKEIRKLARTIQNIKVLTLCGGIPMKIQVGSLEHGVHIVVGTPGRIEELMGKGVLKLDGLTTLVVDEADRMLDMGFQPALDKIIKQLPKQRQTLFFSATYPDKIKSIAQDIMIRPIMVKASATHERSSIAQYFYKLDNNIERITALQLLLLAHRPASALVFCNTKIETQQVTDALRRFGFSAYALHGDLEQKQRDQTLVRFANKSASILVATDVAARGLDIDDLDLVVNYQVARELEMHIHRIGRTGRAGNKGIACTLYSEKEASKIQSLDAYIEQTIETKPLPSMRLLNQAAYKAQMVTLVINRGRKEKIRAADILGALTGEKGIQGKQVGKIDLFDRWAYVAVSREISQTALNHLANGKLKGRTFRAKLM